MKGIVLVETKTWENIKKICKQGAIVDLLIGYEPDSEKSEILKLGLPKLDLDYLKKVLIPKLKQLGFRLSKLQKITNVELKDYPSSWAKKLAFGKSRNFFHIRLKLINV